MGMFDNIVDYSFRCPYCGGINIEIQTKDYDCTLDTIMIHEPGSMMTKNHKKRAKCYACWRKEIFSSDKDYNPHPKTRLNIIEGCGQCRGPACYALARAEDYVERGYVSGFGRSFDVQYKTKNGIAITPAIIKNKDNKTLVDIKRKFMKRLNKDKKAKESFNKVLARVAGDWGLAVLEWQYTGADGFKVLHPTAV